MSLSKVSCCKTNKIITGIIIIIIIIIIIGIFFLLSSQNVFVFFLQ